MDQRSARPSVDVDGLRNVLAAAAASVLPALSTVDDLRRTGQRPGQYHLDLVADAAVCAVLHEAGLRVLSEESGLSEPRGPDRAPGLLAVVDPVDGSTNASLGIPWFATSLCVLDAAGPLLSLVVNLASGVHYEAVRRGGARKDGRLIHPSGCRHIETAVVGVSGLPSSHPGWAQFRALGAAALDMCAVAEGALDGYRVAGGSGLFGWDYLGAMLVCSEAGAVVGELDGRDLMVRDDSSRRPVAAATPELQRQLTTSDI